MDYVLLVVKNVAQRLREIHLVYRHDGKLLPLTYFNNKHS